MRVAAWVVATGLLVCMLGPSSAIMIGVEPFYPDSSLQRIDSIPPGKPSIALMRMTRGQGVTELPGGTSVRNSEGDHGTITWTMTFAAGEPLPHGRFGYTFHLVDGRLPAGLEFTEDAWTTTMRGDTAYPYTSWDDGMSWAQDPFSFRMYITAIDSAGNQSLPSNVIVLAHDGDQAERKKVDYEQRYLGYSSASIEARWTGTDEDGMVVSLVVRPWEIEFDTGNGVVRGGYLMQSGEQRGKPHRIDIARYSEVGPRFEQLGIYEMHGDSLRLCLAPPGEDRPSAFRHDGATRVYMLKRTSP